ncbi:hypothetical protein K438DRAFT_2119961 [Mycena galopus ATCC 62051]|nr:hypothetical protein K438DRAFT_2119961 [Mycena galopus ATCC 62051]
MKELCQQEDAFLRVLLEIQHDPRVLLPCSCGNKQPREVRCADCLQDAVVCRQCWLDKHRNMPTHWALVWNLQEKFFEKTDLCRVKPGAAVFLGHDAGVAQRPVKINYSRWWTPTVSMPPELCSADATAPTAWARALSYCGPGFFQAA